METSQQFALHLRFQLQCFFPYFIKILKHENREDVVDVNRRKKIYQSKLYSALVNSKRIDSILIS